MTANQWIVATVLVLSVASAVLYWININLYRRPPSASNSLTPVSILIPARNEERCISESLQSALASRGIEFEIIVIDDHSTDRTSEIVREIAARDDRVRLIASVPLPDGWSGKQHACHQLAHHARHDLLLFTDADVRLAPNAAARLATFANKSETDLISGVPRQETGTVLEKLVIPLIHFLLLGFLPILGMRLCRHPAFGAGCGQLFLARRAAYDTAGGHAAIRNSFHDGVKLPRAFRQADLRTDLCDATDLAVCRMYRSAGEMWRGLSKNAGEGIGSAIGIVPWTILLLGGQIAPFALFPFEPLPAGIAIAASYSMRVHSAIRFHQSWLGAILHPIGVLILVAIQWTSLFQRTLGRPIGWKDRPPPPAMSKVPLANL
jgi:hypothetical protein